MSQEKFILNVISYIRKAFDPLNQHYKWYLYIYLKIPLSSNYFNLMAKFVINQRRLSSEKGILLLKTKCSHKRKCLSRIKQKNCNSRKTMYNSMLYVNVKVFCLWKPLLVLRHHLHWSTKMALRACISCLWDWGLEFDWDTDQRSHRAAHRSTGRTFPSTSAWTNSWSKTCGDRECNTRRERRSGMQSGIPSTKRGTNRTIPTRTYSSRSYFRWSICTIVATRSHTSGFHLVQPRPPQTSPEHDDYNIAWFKVA